MLTYLGIAARFRPRWIVWENVPGVLSSNGGRDFGTFLGALGELGYGWAYRVLDAQWFGVAQRRRRVFVVGYLGDWRRAAEVLFESESVCRNPAPQRTSGKDIAGTFKGGSGSRGYPEPIDGNGGMLVQSTVGALTAKGPEAMGAPEADAHHYLVQPVAYGVSEQPSVAHCLRSGASKADKHESTTYVAQPVCFQQNTRDEVRYINGDGQIAGALAAESGMKQTNYVAQPVAPSLTASNDPSRSPQSSEVTQQVTAVYDAIMQVRRLTCVECERLQGFPDGYTAIPWRKKPADQCPDGPRYKALGNSMAVPCMRWIGQRIQDSDFLGKT